MCGFILAALLLALLVLCMAPQQAAVLLYKLAIVYIAAISGYIFDLAVCHFAQASGYLEDDWVKHPNADRPGEADYPVVAGYIHAFVGAQYRQAIIIAAFVVGVSLGL